MKKLTTAIILLAIPALVLAGPGKMAQGRKMASERMEMCKMLNLTEEQQKKMDDMRVAHQKEMIPLQADIKLADIELGELIRAGDTSKKLDAAIKKVNDLKAKQFEKQVKHRMEVASILTDEQKAIWRKCHREPKMGKHSRGGCGEGTRMGCMPDGPEKDQG
ncbi:MAG: periplasmic heavy metal sensor [Candidatus Marinimicrobia bacterium]|nr:periplasmic heavy metal sensor [Candidatus Neomarinimicrobiota bacterium]